MLKEDCTMHKLCVGRELGQSSSVGDLALVSQINSDIAYKSICPYLGPQE